MSAGPLIFTEGTQSALILVSVLFVLFLFVGLVGKRNKNHLNTEADLLFLSSFITGSGLLG